MTETKLDEKAWEAAKCFDCGLPYESARFPDLVIPDEIWRAISPTGDEGGLLCPNCISARLEISGFTNVPARFRSGAMALEAAKPADPPAPSIPEGYVMVPREPTQAMSDAAANTAGQMSYADVYHAMISAASTTVRG